MLIITLIDTTANTSEILWSGADLGDAPAVDAGIALALRKTRALSSDDQRCRKVEILSAPEGHSLKAGQVYASASEVNRILKKSYPAVLIALSTAQRHGKDTASVSGVTFRYASESH